MKRDLNEKKLHSYIRDNHLETYMSADIFSISSCSCLTRTNTWWRPVTRPDICASL